MRRKTIKITLHVFTLLSVIAAVTFGQVQISPGITGGPNFATLGGRDVNYAASITRYAIGVSAEVNSPLLPISIQPEVLYSVKGCKEWVHLPTNDFFLSTSTFSYIDIPILVKYYLSVPVIKPFIFIGPSIGILISAIEEGSSVDFPGIQYSLDVKEQMASAEIGAVMGAGITIPLRVFDFSMDVRYDYSITDIYKGNSPNITNRVLAIYASIGF